MMLLHQFSVSLTHCQSSLARKTHEDIRHTAAGQQWTGMSCASKGHLWTECCDSVMEAVNVINSHSAIH